MRPYQIVTLEQAEQLRAFVGKAVAFSFPSWWNDLEDNPDVQKWGNYGIGAAYALVAAVALVQLVRIHLRVPEYGMTTQKVFHLLNGVVCALRSVTFFLRERVEANVHSDLLKLMMLDIPGLVFFTTYTLLVLFWAEIYHQARSMPTGSLRPVFIALNVVVYATQGGLWALSVSASSDDTRQLGYVLSDCFLAVVSVSAALGFLVYGGRLFLMLQRFPIESRGRRKKLREVGMVTSICAGCFSFRAVMVALSAFDRADLELDLLGHPLLNAAFYTLSEVLPSACVLYILRKLPPKRAAGGYQQIPSQ